MSNKLQYEIYEGYSMTDCPFGLKNEETDHTIKVGSVGCIKCHHHATLATALCDEKQTVKCNYVENLKETEK